jgi:hypothetical protein
MVGRVALAAVPEVTVTFLLVVLAQVAKDLQVAAQRELATHTKAVAVEGPLRSGLPHRLGQLSLTTAGMVNNGSTATTTRVAVVVE